MGRRDSNTVVEDVDVDTSSETDEAVVPTETTETTSAPAAAKKEPVRGTLPDGYVTPVGLAKIISEKGLHKNKAGEVATVAPQMVYSYMRNAPADHPFPIETIQDSIGKDRQVVNIDRAVEWWEQKNERASTRAASAKAKAAAKATKAAETTPAVEGAAPETVGEVVEAE